MAKKLKDTKQAGKLISDLSHLVHFYVSSYRPTTADLKKHRVFKELRSNKNIVILKPDKGNGVVVLDRADYVSTLSVIGPRTFLNIYRILSIAALCALMTVSASLITLLPPSNLR